MKKYQNFFLLGMVLLLFIPGFVSANNTPFTDVPETNSHYDSIMELTEAGTISGYADGTFRPDEPITRQHVAVILVNALDLETPTQVGSFLADYSDMSPNHTYAKEIAAVTARGIFQGDAQARFNPDRPITRQQLATVLYQTFHLGDYPRGTVPIYLGNVATSHRAAVQTFANLGLTVLVDDFRPANNVTRGQFATFLVQTLDIENNPLDAAALRDMLNFVNAARAEAGAGPLEYDQKLTDFAQFRADDMALNNYFSHDSPIHGTFNTMFMQHLSSDFRSVGENISVGYRSVKGTFDGWMNSSGHRANILNPNFEYLGFAYHPEGNYWVQVFGAK